MSGNGDNKEFVTPPLVDNRNNDGDKLTAPALGGRNERNGGGALVPRVVRGAPVVMMASTLAFSREARRSQIDHTLFEGWPMMIGTSSTESKGQIESR